MSRTVQLGAAVVFLAVLMILLTPAEDGPVLGLGGKLGAPAVLLGLLALVARMMGCIAPQYPGSPVLACCGAVVEQGGSRARSSPLLC